MKRIYREVAIEPALQEMLRDITKNKNVSKDDICDILSAIVDGVSVEDALFDFWDTIDGVCRTEMVEVDDYADEAYERFKERNI